MTKLLISPGPGVWAGVDCRGTRPPGPLDRLGVIPEPRDPPRVCVHPRPAASLYPLSICPSQLPEPFTHKISLHPTASPAPGAVDTPQSAGKRDISHQFSRNDWKKGKCLDTHCHQVAEEDPDLTLVPCGIILSEFHILPQENPLFFMVIKGLTPGFGKQSKALP